MSRRYNYLILVFLLVAAISTGSLYFLRVGQQQTDPTTLTYYTEQLPPYNYQEGDTLKGAAVDLLSAITTKMRRTVTPDRVNLVPWTEARAN